MNFSKRVSKEEILSNLINLRQLVIEVTDSCNLRCSYCVFRDLYQNNEKRGCGNLSFGKISPLLDYLTGLWNENESDRFTDIGFYGGEPLLNMSLIRQIIEYMEGRNKKKMFTYSLTTNGLLLDKNMDYLAGKGFNLLISLDGDAECQGYRLKQDGSNSHPVVQNNVNLLRNRYPKYYSEKVNFHAIIHKKNSVRKVVEYFLNEFGKVPSLAEVSHDGIRDDKIDSFYSIYQNIEESIQKDSNPDELYKLIGYENPWKISLYQYLKAYSGNIYDTYNSLLTDTSAQRTPTGTCHPFEMKLFVTVNGDIMQCEHIPRNYIYGNVSETGLSLDLNCVAHKFNTLLDSVQSRCRGCSIACSCPVCLFSMEDNATMPRCKEFKTKKQFSQYQDSCLNIIHNNPELYFSLINETYSG